MYVLHALTIKIIMSKPDSIINPGKKMERLILDPKLKCLKNINILNFQHHDRNSVSFDLKIFEETETVKLDFNCEEVEALTKIVKEKVLNFERWDAWDEDYLIEKFKDSEENFDKMKITVQNFLKRNEKKPHLAFCFKHLKEMLICRTIGCEKYTDCSHGEDDETESTSSSNSSTDSVCQRYVPDHTFSVIELFLFCACPTFDDTENSPHLNLIMNSFDGIEAACLRPVFKVFGASYLKEVIFSDEQKRKTKPFCGLEIVLREFNVGSFYLMQHFEDSLIRELAQKHELFEESTRPEVMASLLNKILDCLHKRIHEICFFCYRPHWKSEISRAINFLLYILQKVPRNCLQEVLPLCKLAVCGTLYVRGMPNVIYFVLNQVLGINLFESDCCKDVAGHKPSKGVFNLDVPSLSNLAKRKVHTFFAKYKGSTEDGFAIEKIVNFPFLPPRIKIWLLQRRSAYRQMAKWEQERTHFCDGRQMSAGQCLQKIAEKDLQMYSYLLKTLVTAMINNKMLGKNADKVKTFLTSALEIYPCKDLE